MRSRLPLLLLVLVTVAGCGRPAGGPQLSDKSILLSGNQHLDRVTIPHGWSVNHHASGYDPDGNIYWERYYTVAPPTAAKS